MCVWSTVCYSSSSNSSVIIATRAVIIIQGSLLFKGITILGRNLFKKIRCTTIVYMHFIVLSRRPVDIERGLERIECEIAHYDRADEREVTTPLRIAERLSTLVPLTIPFVADIMIGRKIDCHVIVM